MTYFSFQVRRKKLLSCDIPWRAFKNIVLGVAKNKQTKAIQNDNGHSLLEEPPVLYAVCPVRPLHCQQSSGLQLRCPHEEEAQHRPGVQEQWHKKNTQTQQWMSAQGEGIVLDLTFQTVTFWHKIALFIALPDYELSDWKRKASSTELWWNVKHLESFLIIS